MDREDPAAVIYQLPTARLEERARRWARRAVGGRTEVGAGRAGAGDEPGGGRYLVTSAGEFLTWYPTPPGAGGLHDVVADLVTWFGVPEERGGLGDGDVTVWRRNRLVAVIRRGPDGRGQATLFGGPGGAQGERGRAEGR